MQFKRLKGRMGYRKLYDYLINKYAMVSLSQVRQAVLSSKIVTYYKKRKQEHHTFPNVLERSFKPGKKDVPTVVYDHRISFSKWNENIFLCRIRYWYPTGGYSLDTHQDAHVVKDTIQQVPNAYRGQKRFYFIAIKFCNLPVIQLMIFVNLKSSRVNLFKIGISILNQ
ncbi:transposase [Bacillus cereus]|uniref:transposase n=1 Tax=Bacillus TaxID=1386 RepID=UPI0024B93176|nr:transposase [Bacillus cereus]WHS75911.1 transposase [Bacillus cereus]